MSLYLIFLLINISRIFKYIRAEGWEEEMPQTEQRDGETFKKVVHVKESLQFWIIFEMLLFGGCMSALCQCLAGCSGSICLVCQDCHILAELCWGPGPGASNSHVNTLCSSFTIHDDQMGLKKDDPHRLNYDLNWGWEYFCVYWSSVLYCDDDIILTRTTLTTWYWSDGDHGLRSYVSVKYWVWSAEWRTMQAQHNLNEVSTTWNVNSTI